MFALLGKGKEYWKEKNIHEEMPACRQMFNIFHPFDPVAYRSVLYPSGQNLLITLLRKASFSRISCLPRRIEPLVCEEIMHKPPVIIPYHRGGKRLYVVLKVRNCCLEYLWVNSSLLFSSHIMSNRNSKKA